MKLSAVAAAYAAKTVIALAMMIPSTASAETPAALLVLKDAIQPVAGQFHHKRPDSCSVMLEVMATVEANNRYHAPEVRAMLADDFTGWKHGKKSLFDWHPCKDNAEAEAMFRFTPSEDQPKLDVLTRQIEEEKAAISPPAPSVDDALPRYDVATACARAVASSMADTADRPQLTNFCINANQDAYNELKRIWPMVRPGYGKNWCLRAPLEASIYTNMLECANNILNEQAAEDDAAYRNRPAQPFRY